MTIGLAAAYKGRRVLVTGHTGFKGSWLVSWLHNLGADVCGYALPPPTEPSLYEIARIRELCSDEIADVRDLERLAELVKRFAPEVVFHLAAQAIVRNSYDDPVTTFSTNTMGTVHILEAVRRLGKPCVVVVVTSDKCYENRGWVYGYREIDPMGGGDPYSASKGCAELIVSSWRRSFGDNNGPLRIASARAGNVIGGGDWASDRIVPDCITSLRRGVPVEVRNPTATRPWQHVLEPLSGYLQLGASLLRPNGPSWEGAWNFGPNPSGVLTVRELVEQILARWGSGEWQDDHSPDNPEEAQWLALDSSKAFRLLGWKPTWSVQDAVDKTVDWYRAWCDGAGDMRNMCIDQVSNYTEDAQRAGLDWASENLE